MKTFELWLIESELDESFLDSMKQGFQQSYQQTKQQNQQADSQNLEKFANVAVPAIKRATAFAGMLSQKTGVPLPLATALIASGLTGGPAAIPLAALLYFVKKPLMKGASNVFDAGVNAYNSGDFQKGVANFKQGFVNGAARNPINTLPTGSAPKVAQPNAWNAGLARMGRQGSMQPEHLVSFKNYCLYQEGFGDWAGQKIGSLAGKLSGNVVSAGQKAGNLLKQNLPKLIQFASQNKLAIGKAAFLMGCGALVGYGIGKLTNAAMDAITQNMTHAGVSPQEVSGIRRDLGLQDQSHAQSGTGDPSVTVTRNDSLDDLRIKHRNYLKDDPAYQTPYGKVWKSLDKDVEKHAQLDYQSFHPKGDPRASILPDDPIRDGAGGYSRRTSTYTGPEGTIRRSSSSGSHFFPGVLSPK